MSNQQDSSSKGWIIVITTFIGVIGSITVAYFAFRGAIFPKQLEIEATQKAQSIQYTQMADNIWITQTAQSIEATRFAESIKATQDSSISNSPASQISTAIPTTTVPPTVYVPPPTAILYNLIGSWYVGSDCTVVFYKDNGKTIEGSCDNNAFKHKLVGVYSDSNHIAVTITRLDLSSGCETSTNGFITIIDNDHLTMGQEGWNGCGVSTSSVTQSLIRQ